MKEPDGRGRGIDEVRALRTPVAVRRLRLLRKPVGKALTDDDLLTMLENLGYEVVCRPKDGAEVRSITVRVARADFPIDVPVTARLSGDKSTLCLFVYLADLEGQGGANGERLLKLLELNDVGGRNQFRVNPKTKGLFLARITDNAGMTPAALKRHVESLATTVVETRDHWDAKKWAGAATASKE